MSTNREYPTGALEAAKRAMLAIGVWRQGHSYDLLDALAAMSPEDRAALARWVWPEGDGALTHLDEALTAMRAERDAAECRWCGHVHDPEDGRCDTYTRRCEGRCTCPGEGLVEAYDKINAALLVAEQDCAELRGQLVETEAATVKRIAEWLRGLPGAVGCFASAEDVAATIERKFGGAPDAVK